MYENAKQAMAEQYANRLGRSVTDAPPPLSPVQQAQVQLDNNINTLHEALSRLVDRLQPVLMPEPGQAMPKEGVRPVACTVSQRINESADNVSHAIVRLQGILDRLEV